MSQTISHEQTILDLLRTLPAERMTQVIDFVRFLQWQTMSDVENSMAENERWDQTFAASPATLRHLVQAARVEIQAGHTQAMVFTADSIMR